MHRACSGSSAICSVVTREPQGVDRWRTQTTGARGHVAYHLLERALTMTPPSLSCSQGQRPTGGRSLPVCPPTLRPRPPGHRRALLERQRRSWRPTRGCPRQPRAGIPRRVDRLALTSVRLPASPATSATVPACPTPWRDNRQRVLPTPRCREAAGPLGHRPSTSPPQCNVDISSLCLKANACFLRGGKEAIPI